LSTSSQAVSVLASGGGPEALLISLFNVKWRCSAQAGGVEGSKFCLFSVALPARCVSSISPRFHFRRHAFCFLPLAAILESAEVFCLQTLDPDPPTSASIIAGITGMHHNVWPLLCLSWHSYKHKFKFMRFFFQLDIYDHLSFLVCC
jgi:hypothetical protein